MKERLEVLKDEEKRYLEELSAHAFNAKGDEGSGSGQQQQQPQQKLSVAGALAAAAAAGSSSSAEGPPAAADT